MSDSGRTIRSQCEYALEQAEAKIEALEEQLAAAKQHAAYEADVARQAVAEIAAARERLTAQDAEIKRLRNTVDGNGPIRLYLALTILRAWNHGSAGYSADVVIAISEWIDGGMKGPIPWIENPFFAEWAAQQGYSNCDGYVGFRCVVVLAAAPPSAPQIEMSAPAWNADGSLSELRLVTTAGPPSAPAEQPAREPGDAELLEACHRIWEDCLDRRGIKWELEKIADAVRDYEIFPAWMKIMRAALKGGRDA